MSFSPSQAEVSIESVEFLFSTFRQDSLSPYIAMYMFIDIRL